MRKLIVGHVQNVREVLRQSGEGIAAEGTAKVFAGDLESLRLKAKWPDLVWFEDFLDLSERIDIDTHISMVRKRWYDPQVLGLNIVQSGVALGKLLENELTPVLVSVLKLQVALRNYLSKNKTDAILLCDADSLISRVASIIAAEGGIRTEVVSSIHARSFSRQSTSQRVSVGPVTIPYPLLRLYTWLAHSLYPFLSRLSLVRFANGRVLFLNYSPTFFSSLREELGKRGFAALGLTNIVPIFPLRPGEPSEYERPMLRLCLLSRPYKSPITLRNHLIQSKNLESLFKFKGLNYWPIVRPWFVDLFGNVLPTVAGAITECVRLLRQFNVNCVIGWGGVSSFEKCVMEAGRLAMVPTLVIQHGLMAPQAEITRVPESAQLITVWGDSSRDTLVRDGAKADSILVLGSPHFDKYSEMREEAESAEETVTLISHDLEQPVRYSALFRYDEPEILLRTFLVACKRIGHTNILIKTRVARDDLTVLRISAQYGLNPRVAHTNLEEVLRRSRIVVAYDSTILEEAMIVNRPTICLIPTERAVRFAPASVKAGASLFATSEEELAEQLQSLLVDSSLRRRQVQKGEDFVSKNIANLGAATKPMSDLVCRLATSGHSSQSG